MINALLKHANYAVPYTIMTSQALPALSEAMKSGKQSGAASDNSCVHAPPVVEIPDKLIIE